MEFNMPRQRVAGQTAATPAPQGSTSKKRARFNVGSLTFGALMISVVVLVFALLLFLVMGGNGKSEKDVIKASQYQAVFLNDQNGQVYFGHLSTYNARFYRLTDIYYVKVDSKVQPDTNQTAQQNISLAKLGNELHGPEDEMFISRDKVLFWENLKTDGQVAKAIAQYKTTGATASPTPAPSTEATPAPTATPKK